MGPQPEVGLLGDLVVAPGGQLPQPPAPVGAGEPADRHGHAIDQRDGWVEVDLGQQVLVEAVLDGPQVGRLAEEGGAVHPAQGREPVGPVAAEVLVQAAVGVDAEKLADAFDGQDLAVGQGGRRAAPAQGTGLTGPPVSRSYG
jgi:hypothetical protein